MHHQNRKELFSEFYRGKRVLITGNTGFKGSWLTVWLLKMGAEVIGVSKSIPESPSFYRIAGLDRQIRQYLFGVEEVSLLSRLFETEKPEVVFHLAAQPLVTVSMNDPLGTIQSNVMGTSALLEVVRHYPHPLIAVIATTDKCYENKEWDRGYRETDELGGKDPYSASKAAAEIIYKAFHRSFLVHQPQIQTITARAGNVIGGGDWSPSRIVPDCIRAWSKQASVVLRGADSVRPWQHVLEPLSGYLLSGYLLSEKNDLNGEAFNFGPDEATVKSVLDLVKGLHAAYRDLPGESFFTLEPSVIQFESKLLRLNIEKARTRLNWYPVLDFNQCVSMTGNWYQSYEQGKDMLEYSMNQIHIYEQLLSQNERSWGK